MFRQSRSPDAAVLWRLLDSTVDAVPAIHPNVALVPNARFRLLEILVARLLALLLPNYSWKLTASTSRGVEIHGELLLFEIPDLDIRGRDLVHVLCSRKHTKVDMRQIARNVLQILSDRVPGHLVMTVPASVSDSARNFAKKDYERSARKSFILFSRSEIAQLLANHLAILSPLLRACADSETSSDVIKYLQARLTPITPNVLLEVSVPAKGETGRPFVVFIHIYPNLSVNTLRLRWNWRPVSDPQHSSSVAIQLVSPPSAANKRGIELSCIDQFDVYVRLKFRCFRRGNQPLGTILLFNDSGSVRQEYSLGKIELAEQYHPVFFREPYMADLSAFSELLSQAEGGRVRAVVVTGSGGAGKTRLCEEFGFSSEQRGFRWISRSHTNHPDQPYKVFGDLFRSLVPEPPSTERPSDVVYRYIASLNPSLAEAALSFRGAIFPYDMASHTTTQTINREVLLRVLLTLLVDQSHRHPLCVHLSDLHWSSSVAIRLFMEAIDRLGELESSATTRLIFLFEGRIGEGTRESDESSTYSYSSAGAWDTFVGRFVGPVFRLKPLDPSQSRAFLVNLFEHTESLERRVPSVLIPNQETLLWAILRRGEGNPFHMIEQIRLLRHHGVIAQNLRTGLLFLAKRIPKTLTVPATVQELVHRRFAYLEEAHPGVAALIRAVALVGDRVDNSLYERLRQALCPSASVDQVSRSEFLALPAGPMGEVRFRHENYYRIIGGLDLKQRDAVVDVYTAWYTSRGDSAEVAFQRGRIASEASQPDYEQIRSLFVHSWGLFEAQKKFAMAARVLEHLVRLFPDLGSAVLEFGSSRLQELVGYWTALAKRTTWTGDWEYAHGLYLNLINSLSPVLEERAEECSDTRREWLEFEHSAAQIELANIEISTMHYGSAMGRLGTVSPEIDVAVRTAEVRRVEWQRLAVRAANRLAVAYWFEGEVAKALWVLRDSLRLAKRLGDTLQISTQLRDLGTARIHSNPSRGEAMIENALALVRKVEHIPRQEYILGFHLVMAKLISASKHSVEKCLSCARENVDFLEEIYVRARREGYVSEESGTALTAGVCHALLGNQEAARWFRRSISTAQRAGLLEFLWKGHLNLAQLCISRSDLLEGAGLHAQQAQALLDLDLSRRNGSDRARRRAYYYLALAQLRRIWEILGDERSTSISWVQDSVELLASTLQVRRGIGLQPLHLAIGHNIFFLMN